MLNSTQDLYYSHQGTKVTYRFRSGTQDRRHLIVIFSGYRQRGTYDFSGSTADTFKCDVLWIDDFFDGNHAYYIKTGAGFAVSHAVQALIEKLLTERGLERHECTLTGFSKGASAALFHGIKYGYRNILADAPRINMGSANRHRHPDVFANMTETGSQDESDELDLLIPNLLAEDVDRNRNIYLFSSPQDYQYETEVEPYLHDFEKYSNFNFIFTESPLVQQHIDVTSYNVPLILSILVCLADRAAPRLGFVNNGDTARAQRNGSIPSLNDVQARKEVVAAFSRLTVREGLLFPEGHVFVKGHSAGEYGDIQRRLILNSTDSMTEFALGGVTDPRMSSKFFENAYCDYSKVAFASIGRRGIWLEDLSMGAYELSITYKHAGHYGQIRDIPSATKTSSAAVGESLVSIETRSKRTFLIKRPIMADRPSNIHFSVENVWSSNGQFHVEGYFVTLGQPTPNWADIHFYVVFCAPDTTRVLYSKPLAKDTRSDCSSLIGDPWHDYSKSYFATPKYTGISFSEADSGYYDIYITSHTCGAVGTIKALSGFKIGV